MYHSNRELWLSFIAIVGITLVYFFVIITVGAVPAASNFFGHSIGVLGFILMLATETLYSLRKRSRGARWGKMATWMEFHIFTGIVGPYMVLLHAAWKFNGLAGITMLLTILIVASGFVGRYIYTAIPRTADGIEIEVDEIERQIAALDIEIRAGARANPRGIKPERRQKTLRHQANGLATARRFMSLWHTIHIPIGMALFTAAFIHAGAAIYYATLLK